MDKYIYTCPHCGDKWEYRLIVDHENGKSLVTNNYDFIENGQDCVCYKCHKHYTMTINSPSDIRMDDFIYNAWRHCKK